MSKNLGDCFFAHVGDGSLRGTNREIITEPATLPIQLDKWGKFFRDVAGKELFNTEQPRAGIHVHLSRISFTDLHLGKMLKFINAPANRPFKTTIARREEPTERGETNYFQYCNTEVKEDAVKGNLMSAGTGNAYENQHLGRNHNRHDKYAAVNLMPANTIELRMFKTAITELEMLYTLEFVHAVVMFSRSVHRFKMTSGDFVKWLSNKTNKGKYPSLEQYLRQQAGSDDFVQGLEAKKITTKPTSKEEFDVMKANLVEKRKAERKAEATKKAEQRKFIAEKKARATEMINNVMKGMQGVEPEAVNAFIRTLENTVEKLGGNS